MKKTDFTLSRVKSLFKNDEEKALQSVLNKTGFKKEELVADHSEKLFIWTQVDELKFTPGHEEAKTPITKFKVEFIGVESENMAVRQAMEAFDTIEGNLEKHHTKKHYVFTKIRG